MRSLTSENAYIIYRLHSDKYLVVFSLARFTAWRWATDQEVFCLLKKSTKLMGNLELAIVLMTWLGLQVKKKLQDLNAVVKERRCQLLCPRPKTLNLSLYSRIPAVVSCCDVLFIFKLKERELGTALKPRPEICILDFKSYILDLGSLCCRYCYT